MLPPLAAARVLDHGCGFGASSRWVCEMGAASVLGVDRSENMLARARAQTRDPGVTPQLFGGVMQKSQVLVVATATAILEVVLLPCVMAGGPCPPGLARLMPKSAANVTGQYNSAGMIGMGFAAGDLPFENICANQTTKFPGKVTFDIKHYEGDGVQLFKMQIDSEEQQRVLNKRQEFEKASAKLKAGQSRVDSVIPLKTETVPGGTIMYYGYWTDCSEGAKRSKPTAQLLGVAHNGDTAINIEISGFISVDAAKAAATEIIANFTKADLSSLGKGK